MSDNNINHLHSIGTLILALFTNRIPYGKPGVAVDKEWDDRISQSTIYTKSISFRLRDKYLKMKLWWIANYIIKSLCNKLIREIQLNHTKHSGSKIYFIYRRHTNPCSIGFYDIKDVVSCTALNLSYQKFKNGYKCMVTISYHFIDQPQAGE